MWYQRTNSSTLASFHPSPRCILSYTVITYIKKVAMCFRFLFVLMVCLPELSSLSYPQRPNVVVDTWSILLQFYPILLTFLFCTRSVLDCNLLCFIVNKTIFQSNSNPKSFFLLLFLFFFFAHLLSRFCFTLTENICCMLPLIPVLFLKYVYRFSMTLGWVNSQFICEKPHKPEWYWQGSTWVNYLLFVLMFYLLFFF